MNSIPPRVVSAAVNGNNQKGVSLGLDIIGFNYNLKMPDGYHKQNPKRAVFGSETSSAISDAWNVLDGQAPQHGECL